LGEGGDEERRGEEEGGNQKRFWLGRAYPHDRSEYLLRVVRGERRRLVYQPPLQNNLLLLPPSSERIVSM
jgi:hypothetical protein